MAQLKIKSIQTFYTITENEAKEIREIFHSDLYPAHHRLELGQLSFRKSDIQLIQLEGENEESQEKFRKRMTDWNEYWNELNRKTPEYRAEQNVKNYYSFWWYAYTGKWETEKDDQAKEIAMKFFEENPDRNVVDFNLWKNLMPSKNEPEELMGQELRKFALGTLTSTLESDMRMYKYKMPVQDEINPKDIPF